MCDAMYLYVCVYILEVKAAAEGLTMKRGYNERRHHMNVRNFFLIFAAGERMYGSGSVNLPVPAYGTFLILWHRSRFSDNDPSVADVMWRGKGLSCRSVSVFSKFIDLAISGVAWVQWMSPCTESDNPLSDQLEANIPEPSDQSESSKCALIPRRVSTRF